MELGPQTRMGWCQEDFEAYKSTFPNIDLIDASDMLWRLRMRYAIGSRERT